MESMFRRVDLLLLAAAAFPAAGLLAQSAPSAPAVPPLSPPAASSEGNPAVFTTPAPGSSQPAPNFPDSSQTASSQVLSNEDLHGDTPRIKSSELARALSDSLPQYQAPQPQAAAQPKPEDDQPRNGIIRLPNYVVKEARPPIFTEKQLYTKQGLTDLNISRYVGLDPSKMPSPLAANITRFLFADGANQDYEDAQRQAAISDAGDMAQNAAIAGDPGESEFIKRVSNDTYLRSANDSDLGTGNASVAHMNDDEAGWGAPVPPPR